jgi:hypothetical protein
MSISSTRQVLQATGQHVRMLQSMQHSNGPCHCTAANNSTSCCQRGGRKSTRHHVASKIMQLQTLSLLLYWFCCCLLLLPAGASSKHCKLRPQASTRPCSSPAVAAGYPAPAAAAAASLNIFVTNCKRKPPLNAECIHTSALQSGSGHLRSSTVGPLVTALLR